MVANVSETAGYKSLEKGVLSNKKEHVLLVSFSHIMSVAEIASVSSEFNIFAHRRIQTYRPVDHNDMEFLNLPKTIHT